MTYRELVLHAVEEFARHAGHADIIREQVAGAQAGQLTMAVEGIAGNDLIQPGAGSRPTPERSRGGLG